MPRDDDEMLLGQAPTFGSGVIGVCDVCGKRQAVIVLQKERFKLCVLDFLNKSWNRPGLTPGAPLPPYRSERVWFPTDTTTSGKAPAISLSPTKVVKHPVVLLTPDIYGLTTTVLDAAIRFARAGFEVLLPDVSKTSGVGPSDHVSMRLGARFRGGVPIDGPRLQRLRRLYADALSYAKTRELADPEKSAVFGASYGGSLAVTVAAADPSLSAVVLAYPVPVRPSDRLRLVSAPLLFLHAGRDPVSSASRKQVEASASEDRPTVRFVDFPQARHNFLARDLTAYRLDDAEAAWGASLDFLREKLLPPPPKPPSPPRPAATPVAPAAPPPATASA